MGDIVDRIMNPGPPAAVCEFNSRSSPDRLFLTNFFMSPFIFEGEEVASAEHAYQAAKSTDEMEKIWVLSQPTPSDAKRIGKNVSHVRPDWENVKVDIMEAILRAKFSGDLKEWLTTGRFSQAELVHTCPWEQVSFWGIGRSGQGANMLGKLLMKIREEMRKS